MEGTGSRITKEELSNIRHLSDILHLFHHRNNNQHRRSTWWRPFSLFRKQLRTFLVRLETLNEAPTTHLARTKKRDQDQQTRIQIQQSLVFWRDVLVPKWQHAFSQLAANGRFAVLGLVLLSTLAEVCRTVGITAAFEDLGQAEVEKVLERFAEEGWEGRDDVGLPTSNGQSEDIGEVLTREAASFDVQSTRPITEATVGERQASKQRAAPTSKRNVLKRSKSSIDSPAKTRKKSKKADAIDDLFSGLG
ncbi:hypothetical protein B0A55_03876 [Friedmanniomyces simplex]|uniref:RNase MRP protein 1 RNA binding domain-containing protein n=1 Tax=Friedmanniomyces simplex TaxID=329884 RepID=A0A4U0XMS0_9PEZI|nr:hypothetical protein B0A55_03876 [Friedmanniomyces simplex]